MAVIELITCFAAPLSERTSSGVLSSSLICLAEDTKTMRVSGASISNGCPFDYPRVSIGIKRLQNETHGSTHLMVSMANDTGSVEEIGPSANAFLHKAEKATSRYLETIE
jgi:hypothetical protein